MSVPIEIKYEIQNPIELNFSYMPFIKNGGLFVLGTEKHESRRVDNQLRGRSGRQGDHGESQFYLSLEDEMFIPCTWPRFL